MNAKSKSVRCGIGPRQIALVQLAKRQLELDDATYRAILRRAAGVESSTELDDAGLRSALVEFARLGFVHTRKPDPTRLTALQWKLVDARAKAVGYVDGLDDVRFAAWLVKGWGVDHPRKLTGETLQSVLEGLRKFGVNRAAKPRDPARSPGRRKRAAKSTPQPAEPPTA